LSIAWAWRADGHDDRTRRSFGLTAAVMCLAMKSFALTSWKTVRSCVSAFLPTPNTLILPAGFAVSSAVLPSGQLLVLTVMPDLLFVISADLTTYNAVRLESATGAHSGFVAALPDGRAVVHVAGSPFLQLVDVAAGTIQRYRGSHLADPGAARARSSEFGVRGDALVVHDMSGGCLLVAAGARLAAVDFVAGVSHSLALPTAAPHRVLDVDERVWVVRDARGLHAITCAEADGYERWGLNRNVLTVLLTQFRIRDGCTEAWP
jgi:hypothetical protein